MQWLEYGFGLDIVLFFHQLYQPFNAWLWIMMHFVGSEKGFVVCLPIIYWVVDKKLGLRLFILIMSGAVMMNGLKLCFARPRPFEAAPDLFVQTVHQSGFGLPSGHVWLSVLLAGFLVVNYFTKRNVIIAIIYVALMAVSRMVLGVHYAQDVIFGLILGAFNLWLFLKYSPYVFSWFLNKPSLTQMLYLVVFALLVQLIAVWLHDAFEYRKSILAASGVLVGGVLGGVKINRTLCFEIKGRAWLRICKIVLGLILLGGFYVVITQLYYAIFENTQLLLANLFYQIQYMLFGVWMTLIVPLILLKLNLFEIKKYD